MRRRTWVMTVLLIAGGMPFFGSGAEAQATYGQQIAVVKMLKPDVKVIGVFTTTMTDGMIEKAVRAGLGQGVKILVARPKEAREISDLYRVLVKEKSAEILWIPDQGDEMMVGIGFEFLRSLALPDRIGLLVPTQQLLAGGGVLSVQSTGEKLMAYVNKKTLALIGAQEPAAPVSGISFVEQ